MKFQRLNADKGFTLIELMIVVVIIAIIAAIAIPSYQRYVVRNHEAQAKTKMLNLQVELERWRLNTLTYRNFKPLAVKSDDGSKSYSYDADDKKIYVPTANPATAIVYTITLVNGEGESLVGDKASTSWLMIAEPNDDLKKKGANRFLLTSTGLKCQSVLDTFCPATSASLEKCTCEAGATSW